MGTPGNDNHDATKMHKPSFWAELIDYLKVYAIVLAVIAALSIGVLILTSYLMFGNLPNPPKLPPKLSAAERKLPGTMTLLMQQCGPIGPIDEFYLVAFNPTIERSVVIKTLTENEVFNQFGVEPPQTSPVSPQGTKRYIELYATSDGDCRVLYEVDPETKYWTYRYSVSIFVHGMEHAKLRSTSSFVVDRHRLGLYWREVHDQPYHCDVHFLPFENPAQETIVPNSDCSIVGANGNILYALSGSTTNENCDEKLVRHDLRTGETKELEVTEPGWASGAGNINDMWAWNHRKLSDIGASYTVFIDLDSERFVRQHIPGSVYLKTISVNDEPATHP